MSHSFEICFEFFFIVFVVLSIKKLEGPTNIYESNNYKTDFLENIYTLNDDNLVSKTSIYVNKELNTLEKVSIDDIINIEL